MRKSLLFVVLTALILILPCFAMADIAVGMIEDATMHTVVVHTDDGESLVFSIDEDTEIVGYEGLVVGEHVMVDYDVDGDTDIAYTVTVLNTVIGEVTQATKSVVTIKPDDEDKQITFTENDDTVIIGKKGVTVGKKVQVAYEGSLAIALDVQTVKVWEIFAEQTLKGTIESVNDDDITVNSDGESYTFPLANAYIDKPDATVEGNQVTLYFFGEIDEYAEIQQVTLHSVYAEKPVPVQHHVAGTVISIAARSVSIQTAKGDEYKFRKDSSTKVRDDGSDIVDGDTVKCYYSGDYKRNMTLDKISLVRHAEDEPEVQSVKGKVVDATMNVLTIKSGKHTYVFSIAEEYENDLSNGLMIDNKVRVFYTGTLKNTKKMQKVTVVKLEDA